MAKEGEASAIQATVAEVASRIFGTPINADAVIGETLTRTTDDRLRLEDIRPLLPGAFRSPLPAGLPDQLRATHPLAVGPRWRLAWKAKTASNVVAPSPSMRPQGGLP